MLKTIGWLMYLAPIIVILIPFCKDLVDTSFYKSYDERTKRILVGNCIGALMLYLVIMAYYNLAGYLLFTK